MNRESPELKYSNCFSDLRRAAVAFYLNPQGKNHQIFLKHSRRILEGMKDKFSRELVSKIECLEKKTTFPLRDRKKITNLADEILTLGLLLKGKMIAKV